MRTAIRMYVVHRFSEFRWGGLAAALLLGVKDELDSILAAMYRDAGCSHILALSGMHLAIIAGLLAFFLKKPLGLKPSACVGAFFITLYVYLVGNLPSLNRAAIMYLLGTFVILRTLPTQGASLLGFAFLIQLSFQPQAGHSLSFILSYLALGGIIFIGKPVCDLLKGYLPDVLAHPLSASIGAFISTAVVVAYSFGTLRPIGIVAGLVMIPLTTAFMLGALLFLVVGGGIAPALSFLYDALTSLATLAARVPGLSVSDPLLVFLVSLLVTAAIFFLHYQVIRKNTLTAFD
jgi:competence protein ComEC